MLPTFENSEDLLSYLAEREKEWLVIVSNDERPYLLTYGHEGDPFTQTFPEGDEDGHLIERGTTLLDNHPGGFYPVKVVWEG